MHVQLCSETRSVCHSFWREHLTLKSCTCSAEATGMGSPAADLAATWATLQCFAISATDVDHIDTYPAGAVVNFQPSGAVLCLPTLYLPQGLEPTSKPPAKPAPKAAKPRAKPSTKSAAKPAVLHDTGAVECLGCKKSEVHSNAPIIPPCPASKRTGEAGYSTF